MMDVVLAPLVGRDADLAVVLEALGIGDDAAPSAVLLGGDAGIGKTRLTVAVGEAARADGVRVLSGHCLDLGADVDAFQPLAEVFSQLPSQELSDLVEAQPTLEVLTSPTAADDTDRVRTDVLVAVARALEQLAADEPLLVVLEDLHWADASTRHLVQFLLARRFARRVLLLATFRTDDLHRRHPLRPALAEWTRLPHVRRVDLRPLDDDAMLALLGSRSASAVGDRAAAILARAEGNAFYAEELLDAGLDDGRLPEDLADLLLVRVDRLGHDARVLVRAVACAAGSVREPLLRTVVEDGASTVADVEPALREAVDQRVLTLSGDLVSFRHALLAEAVRDDMLPGERRRVHAAYLAAATADRTALGASATALHAHGAGDLAAAFAADVRAARDARRVGGHDEAALHLQRALTVVDHAPDEVDRTDLVLEVVDALVASARLRTAASLLDEQLALDGGGESRARLLHAAGRLAILSGSDADADTRSRRALEAAEGASPLVRARAESLRALVLITAAFRRDDEAREHAERAVELAESVGADQVAAEARTTIIRVLARSGPDDERTVQGYEELAESARSNGDVLGELRLLHSLALRALNVGDLDEAHDRVERLRGRAEATGWRWAPYGFDGRFFAAVTAYLRGEWDDVVRLCDHDLEGATRLARICLAAVRMLVSAGRGEPVPEDVVARVRARWTFDQYPVALHSGTALIDLVPDVASAEQVHDDVVAALDALWRDPHGAHRLRTGALLAGRLGGADVRTVTAGERRRRAERAAELLEVATVEHGSGGGPGGLEGQAWLARLRAERARLGWLAGDDLDVDAVVTAWEEAVAAFDRYGEVYELARSRVRLAQVLQAAGRRHDVEAVLRDAETQARTLGARPLLDEIDSLRPPAATGRADATLGTGAPPLTPREREVLALVAEGRTNGEVAKALFISTKTASVHVSNILAKLGVASRTEAAAVAHRHGLVP